MHRIYFYIFYTKEFLDRFSYPYKNRILVETNFTDVTMHGIKGEYRNKAIKFALVWFTFVFFGLINVHTPTFDQTFKYSSIAIHNRIIFPKSIEHENFSLVLENIIQKD